MATHNLLIRVLSAEDEVLLEDSDFLESAVYDWFDSVLVHAADLGDRVQLVSRCDGRVLHEEIKY